MPERTQRVKHKNQDGVVEPRVEHPNDAKPASRRSASTTLQRKIIARERRILANAFERLEDDGTTVQATALVVAARRRFVIGEGKSFAYATLLAGDLSAGLSQVTLIDGAIVRPLDILADVRNSDVLIAFSVLRYRRYTIEFSRQFRAAGGSVVAITDSPAAPICAIASVSIVVPTENTLDEDSPTALVAAIHVLTALTTASAKGARRRLAKRQKLTRALNIYFDEG
jgi:DNA-binding MurR/RpiR family transcriptional regulator